MSAHRDPETVADYCRNARMRGLQVIIAGAGLSAALPGVAAAHTDLPVIGVPLSSRLSAAGGLDAILSVVQMPPGRAGRLGRPGQRQERRPPGSCESWAHDRPLHARGDWRAVDRRRPYRGLAPGRGRRLRGDWKARRRPSLRRSAPPVHRAEEVAEREKVLDHDVAAFVDVLSASAGQPAGRWIHYGLTSSDVLDTALAAAAPRGRADRARRRRAATSRRSPRRRASTSTRSASAAPTASTPSPRPSASSSPASPSRPTRNRERLRRAFDAGRVRRDQRRRRHLLGDRPGLRGARAGAPRPRRPSRSPRRSSRATATPSCSRRSPSPAPASSASRPRSATCSAPRCARSRSRSAPARRRAPARCRTSATRSPPSGSPAWRACCAATRRPRLENVALWHERDISHSGAERVILPDSTILARLHAAPRDPRRRAGSSSTAERMRANLDLTRGALFSQRVLLALVAAGHDAATTPTGSSRRTPRRPGTRARRCASCSPRAIWTSTWTRSSTSGLHAPLRGRSSPGSTPSPDARLCVSLPAATYRRGT